MDEQALEKMVRQLIADGKTAEAAVLALHGGSSSERKCGYGASIFEYLYAIVRDRDEATDVFSDFLGNVLENLRDLGQDTSLKVWLYNEAYRAAYRYWRRPNMRAMSVKANFPRWLRRARDFWRRLCRTLSLLVETVRRS